MYWPIQLHFRQFLIWLMVNALLQVKSSFIHPQQNFFGGAGAGAAYFQAVGGGISATEFGFHGFPIAPSISYPSQAFIPQQISPFPSYWSPWWKPPVLGNELKPSLQSWDTSYSVPCGDYTIHPFVVANVRYSSFQHQQQQQQIIPHYPWSPFGHYTTTTTTKSESNPIQPTTAQLEPISALASSASTYPEDRNDQGESKERLLRSIRGGRSFSYPPATGFPSLGNFYPGPPENCEWKFKAADGSCKLKFSCSTFNLPALFRCEENFVQVSGTDDPDLKFCGNRRPKGSYFSTSEGFLQLKLHSQSPAGLMSAFDCTVHCTVEQHLQKPSSTAAAVTTSLFSTPINVATATGSKPIQNGNSNSKEVVETDDKKTNLLLHQALSHTQAGLLNQFVTNALTPPKIVDYKKHLRHLKCKCGQYKDSIKLSVVSRIIGGNETIEGEFPWTAALVRTFEKNRVFCGATLINDRWLVTAAHCADPKKQSRNNRLEGEFGTKLKPSIEVLLNPYNISTTNRPSLIRAQINRILIHSRYNSKTFDYDIALLRLAKPLELEEKYTQWTKLNNAIIESKLKKQYRNPDTLKHDQADMMVPICLPASNGKSFYDSEAIVTGFGKVNERGPPSETLMQTQVQIFNDSMCKELYENNNTTLTVTQQMICAGRLNGHMDSCIGDSGGPLLVQQNGQNVLTGIVSWGNGCGRPYAPGVYTNVAKFVDWIYSNTYLDSNWCTD